jgi:hypothetical protein
LVLESKSILLSKVAQVAREAQAIQREIPAQAKFPPESLTENGRKAEKANKSG